MTYSVSSSLISGRLRYFPTRAILFLVGWSAIVSGCTIAPEVFTISSTSDAVVPAYGRKDYGHALAAIASIMSRDFNLSLVDVLVTVYPSKASYESGAIAEGLRQRERLRQRGIKVLSEEEYIQSWKILAVSSPAIGGYRNVHLENSRISTFRWDAWVSLLAHELTHSAQNELVRGGPSSSDRWLVEGFAEWVGFKVADKFGAENFAEARQRVVDRIANARSYQTLPSLNQLVTGSDWTTWMRTLGYAGTYGQAFLAVDVLVEEKGIEAIVHYFSLFGKVNNRELNFLMAFGETLKSFVERFDKRPKVLALERKRAPDEAKRDYINSLGLVSGFVAATKNIVAVCNERFPEFAAVNKTALEAWIHRNSKTIDEVNGHLLKAFGRSMSAVDDDVTNRYLEQRRREFFEVAEEQAKEICRMHSETISPDKIEIENVMKLQLEIIRKQNLKTP